MDDPVFDVKSPLYIEDATNHENVYSARTDTSTGFLSSLIRKYSFPDYGYTVPRYPVDKCTVIRASLFDDTGDCLDSIAGTYFVGFQGRSAYQDIYTASLVTAPENLFDDDIGIYVTGNTFRQFSGELPDESSEISPWWLWPSNYSNKGMDWERASYITLFDNHQNIVLSQKCGIRIKGGGSRATLPKSLSCYAREIYDGSNRFDANIFQTDSLYFFYPCPGSRVNSGIASIYGRFRYFSQLHNFTFRHFSSHLFAPKSSKSSSKFFRKSGRQPFHFLAGRSISSVCIVVQGHIDAVVPHDILQCFRVHSGTCHFRAERMP